jgi:hypothetical protein
VSAATRLFRDVPPQAAVAAQRTRLGLRRRHKLRTYLDNL